jgi:hypothetical protein
VTVPSTLTDEGWSADFGRNSERANSDFGFVLHSANNFVSNQFSLLTMIQRVTLLAISSFRATICSTTSKRTFLPLGRVSPSNTLADHKSHQKRNERSFSKDFSAFYHIEVSNAANPNSTQLTVSGPDVDGILASMTVALAVQGCSLVELHAAKNVDGSIRSSRTSTSQIKDTFLVVDR